MSDDCIHANKTPAYTVSGNGGTLVVETCDNCGEKVDSYLIPKSDD
ncbi:hypothetical protein [Actinomadura macrotermitis]|uniref:Uncharacterized protein n=1 Tax=Actinomadura macrotermitis TaxID=2585200 RepID=A0A7K0C8T6_9ACTN|nr:hypothetical protein [Actinomadura macrotermitis]MQY09891.1 hypothetical protein [Actinomadura macrotermitis]